MGAIQFELPIYRRVIQDETKTYWGNPFYDDLLIFLEMLPSSQDKFKPLDLNKGIFQMYEKNNVTEFKRKIKERLEFKRKPSWPYTVDIFLTLYVSGTKNEVYEKDLDNLLKTIFDTLKGIVFQDDRQVRKLSAEKFIAERPNLTGIVVGIKKLDNSEAIELFPTMWSINSDAWWLERDRKISQGTESYFDFY